MDREVIKARVEPTIPGYRIEGLLGRGATGTVYRARQDSVDRIVALKVLHPELVGAKGAERRLQREARTTARLAHPNIISAIDMGEVDGVWWYAMELVDGESLQERIQTRRLTEREALRLFIPLVEALQHAFERSVVHRDIKPSNILVEHRGGRALIVDLGLAYAEDDPALTKHGATLGTPHYISPEQARDPSGADSQSDLWSFGATMYHAVTGRTPFVGESVAEILSSVLYEPVPDPRQFAPELSDGFVLVLRKCLTRDRTKRYVTPAELLADLERVRERRMPTVARRSLEPIQGNLDRRLRRLAWPAALLVIVVSASATAWQFVVAHDTRGDPGLNTATAVGATVLYPELAAMVHGPANQLVPAIKRGQALRADPGLSVARTRRLEEIADELRERLAKELHAHQGEWEPRIEELLKHHELAQASTLAQSDCAVDFAVRVGGTELPGSVRDELLGWTKRLEDRVAEERASAREQFALALDAHWRNTVHPKVDRLESANGWRAARALLTSEIESWVGAAGGNELGLDSLTIESVVGELRASAVAARLDELDAHWKRFDRELVEWVEACKARLRSELERRETADARVSMRSQFQARLLALGMTSDDQPAALLHNAAEAAVLAEDELGQLATALALADAETEFELLEDRASGLWLVRRYDDLVALYAAGRDDRTLIPVRAQVELRLRAARLLAGLLHTAANSLGKKGKQTVSFTVGSIEVRGALVLNGDLLENGFAVQSGSGRPNSLGLCAPRARSGVALVSYLDIERLAELAPEGRRDGQADHQLLRLLLRTFDGEDAAARAAWNAGPLPPDDLLVDEAARIVENRTPRDTVAQAARRTEALKRLNSVRRRADLQGDESEPLLDEIEVLLNTALADGLKVDEREWLRRRRDVLNGKRPAPVNALLGAYAGALVTAGENGRLSLRWDFTKSDMGAFKLGNWFSKGAGGWSAPYSPGSEAEFLNRPSPTLALGDPLRLHTDPFVVRIKLVLPTETPPERLAISVAGFHVVFLTNAALKKGSWYADSDNLAATLQLANSSQAYEFTPPRQGSTFEVQLTVNRSNGQLGVVFNGKDLGSVTRTSLPGDGPIPPLCIRSWETLALLSVTLEATRR